MNNLLSLSTGGRLLALGVALALLWALLLRPDDRLRDADPADGSGEDLIAFLSGPATGDFEPVTPGRVLTFPRDHGAHPGFRQEWWYFTGRLMSGEGREFGYQLTFFRFAGGRQAETPDSAWHADQTWMAHIAISDVAGGRFLAHEDFSRQALGLAGAEADPVSVWVNGWSLRSLPTVSPACAGCFSARLSADAGDIALDLDLQASRAPVLQGDGGYSVKTADGAAASYYYSMPAIETRGRLRIAGETFDVNGESWMDREWSSAVLSPGQSGWDWFSLNLDNGDKLMIFQVRERDIAPFISATLLLSSGEARSLPGDGIRLRPTRTWTSPHSASRYPVAWRLTGSVDGEAWSLVVTPALDDQEMNLAFRYYEGLVRVRGNRGGREVTGWGYMELTGYGAN